MSRNRIGAGGPFLQQQIGDSIPQGAVVPAEYHWGTHASAIYSDEARKSVIFRSVAAATVTAAAVSALVFAPQQSYANVQPAVFASVLAGATPRLIPNASAAPQLADLTLQAQIFRPLTTPQGRVPAMVFVAPQVNPTQIDAEITPSQPATSVVSYAFRQIYGSPQLVDLSQQGWVLGTPLGPQGAVPPLSLGFPQADTTQIPALVLASQPAAPIITGVTVMPMPAVPPQDDLSVNPSVIWTPSTFSPSLIPSSQPGGGEYIRFTMRPRNVFIQRYVHDLEPIDEIIEPETVFLGAVEKTIAQAEAAASPIHQEIGLLSALATLSEAYGAHFDSAKAAKAAIEQRKGELIDLDEEEIIAMMMIIAATDDPT